jgi:hypothetical protein
MQLINMNAQQQLASKDAMIQSIQGMILSLFTALSHFELFVTQQASALILLS